MRVELTTRLQLDIRERTPGLRCIRKTFERKEPYGKVHSCPVIEVPNSGW